MGRLTTQVRLLLLTGLMVGLFVLGFVVLVHYDRQQAETLLNERRAERQTLLAQLVDLYSGPLHTLAYDYSYWDEMVDFVKKPDSAWGYDNLFTSLTTYDADAVWVFTTDWRLVYSTSSETATSLVGESTLPWMIQQSFASDPFSHFYVLRNEGLIEIYTAPIQPSNDNDRKTPAQGVLAVARTWDAEFLGQFRSALGGTVQFSAPHIEPQVIAGMLEDEPGVTCVEFPLRGWNGDEIGVLHAASASSFFESFMSTQRARITYVAIYSAIIIVLLAIALRRWVGRPLNAIMQGLEQGSGVALDSLQRSGAEFHQIGGIVTNFFKQRDQLWAEINERKKAEEALRISEHNLEADLEAMTRLQNIGTRFLGNEEQQVLLDEIVDTALGFTNADFGCLQLTREGTEETVVVSHRGASDQEFVLPQGPHAARCRLSAAMLNGQRVVIEEIDGHPELASSPVLTMLQSHGIRALCATPLISRSGRMIGLLNVYFLQPQQLSERALRLLDLLCRQTTDIIEQERAEMEMLDREGLLKATLESTADGILVVDKHGRVTHLNARFPVMWQIPPDVLASRDDDLMLKTVLDQLADPDAFLAKVMALYGSSDESFDTLQFKDGRVFERFSCPLVRDGTVTGRVWSFRDVTERHKSEAARLQLQESLEKAQRMESLGLLAGGVAHDLNNTLGPVVGFAELLMREFPPDSKVGIRLGKISRSANDAAVVIQDLLTLARRGRYEMQPTDINRLIQEYLNSPGFSNLKEIHPHVAFHVNLAPTIGAVIGSDVHLAKAIMNLITNGCEAMPNGGKLTIRTEMRRVERLVTGHCEITPGEYVIVSVKDTGSGIAPEDIEKIFEPYFSKKHLGRSGSGLGLSVVYGVVKDHHGYYDVLSRLNEGTEFALYFPVHAAELPKAPAKHQTMRRGTETILVIDDNAVQREMAGDILGSLGYTVHVAENGHLGIEFLAEQSVDLVLIDMIMEPDFDGLDTFRAIRAANPDQKAIIVSGFSATDRVQETIDLGAAGYLKKPYHINDLATICRKVLDGEQMIVPARV